MKKIKSISFNENNPEEKAMLRYFSRRNFSKYVKELIREDLKKKAAEKKSQQQQQEKPKLKAKNENGTLKLNIPKG